MWMEGNRVSALTYGPDRCMLLLVTTKLLVI